MWRIRAKRSKESGKDKEDKIPGACGMVVVLCETQVVPVSVAEYVTSVPASIKEGPVQATPFAK